MSSSSLWRGAVVGLVALMVAGAFGCGRRARVADARLQRYQERLLRIAARDTGCPEPALTPALIGPDVYTVTGCGQPVEYRLECRRHCRWRRVPTLAEAAARSFGCRAAMIQQQPTRAPHTRVATGCGQQAAFTLQCADRRCAWVMSRAQASALAVAVQPQAQVQAPPAEGGVQATPPAAQGELTALQSQIQTQREAILSCVDTGEIELTVRWTADGAVRVQLPESLSDTAAEGCVQAAVGTLRVVATRAGEITISVR